jgi:hypothetical protein
LLREAVKAVPGGQSLASAYQQYEQRRRAAIALQTTLTDFRLFWDALAVSLSGRDKLIIDAENVPGRRQLLLFDPEQFRVPVPVLVSPDRKSMPPRSPRIEVPEEGP